MVLAVQKGFLSALLSVAGGCGLQTCSLLPALPLELDSQRVKKSVKNTDKPYPASSFPCQAHHQ